MFCSSKKLSQAELACLWEPLVYLVATEVELILGGTLNFGKLLSLPWDGKGNWESMAI